VQQYVTRLPSEGGSARRRTGVRHTVLPPQTAPARPFATYPAAQLSANGYVLYDEAGTAFAAPDERVLLSDEFVADHCFRLLVGAGERRGLVGLEFTPTPDRRVPEIAGVLWADTASAQLRLLEYWYVDERIPASARGQGRAGGEVVFGVGTSGGWLVTGWRMRLPQVVSWPTTPRSYAVRLVEVGAVVVPSRDAADPLPAGEQTSELHRLRRLVEPARVNVTVLDAPGGRPVPQARVTLRQMPDSSATLFEGVAGERAEARAVVGVEIAVVTDSAGRATAEGLLPGVYEMSFAHPEGRDPGIEMPPSYAVVSPTADLHVALAGVGPLFLADQCGRGHRATGVVYGVVTQGDGVAAPDAEPSPYAVVTARWLDDEREDAWRRVTANSRGQYAVCELPTDRPVTIQAEFRRADSASRMRRGSAEATVVIGHRTAVHRALALPAIDR
jgi:hypothetical protein